MLVFTTRLWIIIVLFLISGSTLEDILAAARDQPDSVADDDSDDSDTSGEEEKDQVTVRFTQSVFA